MIAGLDQNEYEEISSKVVHQFGRRWSTIHPRDSALSFVCAMLELPFKAVDLGCYINTYSDAITDYDSTESLDLHGHGHIVIVWRDSGGHSMAFSDGLVYDPGSDAPPCEWSVWIRRHFPKYGRRINRIRIQRDTLPPTMFDCETCSISYPMMAYCPRCDGMGG
jgi:hypothetical protein